MMIKTIALKGTVIGLKTAITVTSALTGRNGPHPVIVDLQNLVEDAKVRIPEDQRPEPAKLDTTRAQRTIKTMLKEMGFEMKHPSDAGSNTEPQPSKTREAIEELLMELYEISPDSFDALYKHHFEVQKAVQDILSVLRTGRKALNKLKRLSAAQQQELTSSMPVNARFSTRLINARRHSTFSEEYMRGRYAQNAYAEGIHHAPFRAATLFHNIEEADATQNLFAIARRLPTRRRFPLTDELKFQIVVPDPEQDKAEHEGRKPPRRTPALATPQPKSPQEIISSGKATLREKIEAANQKIAAYQDQIAEEKKRRINIDEAYELAPLDMEENEKTYMGLLNNLRELHKTHDALVGKLAKDDPRRLYAQDRSNRITESQHTKNAPLEYPDLSSIEKPEEQSNQTATSDNKDDLALVGSFRLSANPDHVDDELIAFARELQTLRREEKNLEAERDYCVAINEALEKPLNTYQGASNKLSHLAEKIEGRIKAYQAAIFHLSLPNKAELTADPKTAPAG